MDITFDQANCVDTYVVKPVHPNTHSDITKESIDTNCMAAPTERDN